MSAVSCKIGSLSKSWETAEGVTLTYLADPLEFSKGQFAEFLLPTDLPLLLGAYFWSLREFNNGCSDEHDQRHDGAVLSHVHASLGQAAQLSAKLSFRIWQEASGGEPHNFCARHIPSYSIRWLESSEVSCQGEHARNAKEKMLALLYLWKNLTSTKNHESTTHYGIKCLICSSSDIHWQSNFIFHIKASLHFLVNASSKARLSKSCLFHINVELS